MRFRTLLAGSTVIAGLTAFSLLALPDAARAQVAPAPAPTTADEANEVDTLVVTGSRIRRNEYTSPSPVQVITTEGSSLEGLFNPTEILQTSSVSAGSTQINNQFTGFVVNGGGGVNTISLRGLGDQRTLVLMNGRRLPPAGTQGAVGAVDLNILPGAVVERYEILKDGASSIYGSDAIAGVVNVIMRDKLDGGRIEVSGDLNDHKGGEEYQISGAFGKVRDRGRFQISGQFYQRKALKFGDRTDLMCQEQYSFDPVTGARNDWIDVDTALPKCLGPSGAQFNYVPVYSSTGAFYGSRANMATDGPAYPANPPIVAAAAADPRLPGYRFAPLNDRDSVNRIEREADFISPVKRYTLYADGNYDFSFGELYGEALAHRRESSQTNVQQMFPIIAPEAPCPVNPFNCPGAAFADTAQTIPGTGLYAPQALILSPYKFTQDVDLYRGVIGLRGKFSDSFGFLKGWDWDGYVSYSKNRGKYSLTGIDQDKLLAGIGGDWANSDFSGICPAGSPAGCRPLSFFAPDYLQTGNFSAADYDYLKLVDKGVTDYTQTIAELQITGDLFNLPAGPLSGAFGVSYRRDELDDQPGPEATRQNFYNLATASRTKGDDSVSEAYGELEAPLLKGAPLAESVTLNLSGRYSDYDSYGGNSTYKVGLNWQLTSQYRLRASYGTSFRAPALFELHLGDQGGFLPQGSVDPCIRYAPPEGGGVANPTIAANCAAQGIPGDYSGANPSAFLVTGGGENLKPEKSKALSTGFIWTPEFADLNIAVDYYEIEVNNQVVSNGAAVVGQCYASTNFPSNPFCDLFTRDLDPSSPTYLGITEIDASFRNIVTQTNRGIDVTGRYTRDIGQGKLTLDAQFTWTLEDTQELFPGFTDDFNNVVGEPAVVGNTQMRYRYKDVTFTWSTDFIGRQSNYDYQGGTDLSAPSNLTTPQGVVFKAKNHTEPMWYHHLSFRYQADKWEAIVGVNNIFDETPPKVSPALTSTGNFGYGRVGSYAFATQYDYVGRQMFVNLTRRF